MTSQWDTQWRVFNNQQAAELVLQSSNNEHETNCLKGVPVKGQMQHFPTKQHM